MKGHYSDVWQAVARAVPDRIAITTRDESVSYEEFARQAGALARWLEESGFRPGDALAILLYNRPEYLVAFFACFATGIAPTPINYRYQAGEVAELLRDSDAKGLLFPSSLSAVATEAAALAGTTPALLEIDDGGTRTPSATQYTDVAKLAGSLPTTPPAGGELRLYTGGTTGRPKAVVWGADDILAVQMYAIYDSAGLPRPDTIEDAVRIAADPDTPERVTLPLTPFMHGTALFNSINTLVRGGRVVINVSPRLDADEAVRLAVDEGVTELIVAGDAVTLPIAEAAERAGITRLGRVSSAISSGMRFSDAAKARLHALGDITILDILASTEGGPFAASITTGADDLPGRLRLLPGAIVLDEDNDEVQDRPGALGMLGFRGTLPKGYWRDPEKTLVTFPVINGVRHVVPGDWARVLEDGYVELLGRGSSVVNTGGEKVYPGEVEEVLLEHPDVADAVVFGMPDERFGEVVTAVVAPATGATLDAEALREHLTGRLAGYKKPRHIVVRASLERSPHGKIDMTRLKAAVAEEITDI